MVAAVIAHTWRAEGLRVGVFKPAVSGLEEGGEADHELLRRASASTQTDDEIAPYRYGPPVSPHLGAELAGEAIERSRLLEVAAGAARGADRLVAEGVGGLMVPLRDDYLVRDLILDLGLPAVIVADPSLGTINHTLLTVEALRSVGVEIATIALNPWPREPGAVELSNRGTLAQLTALPVQTLRHLDLADPDSWPALNPLEPAR